MFEWWTNREIDDAEADEGLPAHVQVVGRPMMDEELLGVMGVVEDVVRRGVRWRQRERWGEKSG